MNKIPDFIHLRLQSSYSMLKSSLKIDKIIQLAKANNMPSVAMTDTDNLFGLLEFSLAAKKAGIQPICGIILELQWQDVRGQVLLIAKDDKGFKNLLKLGSIIYTRGDRTGGLHISIEELKRHNEGIILLTGAHKGMYASLFRAGASKATCCQLTVALKGMFANRFYIEICRLGSEDEQSIEELCLDIAQAEELPIVATNPVLFPNIADHESHDVLLCIAAGVVREEQTRPRVSNQCYFKSAKEMSVMFADLPEALENAANIAKRCHVMAETSSPLLPRFHHEQYNEDELIKIQSSKALEQNLQEIFTKNKLTAKEQEKLKDKYFARLEYELDIICKMNFAGYFLIVSDFILWAKSKSIAVGPGRGSGAGSIVAWTLSITDLDPIEFGLLFERFLNPARISMPDFDIDFCQERREEVINYVRQKYGSSQVGQIITFGKLQAKAVIKDVSRVLSLPYYIADRLTELVPFNAVNPVTLSQAIEEVAELRGAAKGKGLYNVDEFQELISQVLETALSLEGMHRHASTHAAGVVIVNQDIVEIAPAYKDDNSEMLIVQYSMKYCELAGMIKFDFLGLQTLTVITKCIELIAKRDIIIDLEKLDFNDAKTYQMLTQGASTGVFQFESVGMKSALRRLKPDCIDDLIALGALYRPGPMDNIPTYIACKHGKQEIEYLHPSLEKILKATYGVIIYQEQVIEMARILAGYSLGEGDLLRRAMGKKIKAEMDAQEEIFVKGAAKNNISSQQAKTIFATIAKFAGYGFNKSHASAYGVISYQTAYLKANFPVEFFVASMNLDIDNSDKINIFINDAKTLNIEFIPPCINKSSCLFSANNENNSIYFALGAIKNVSQNLAKEIEITRKKIGSFTSVAHFLQSINPKLLNKRSLENLIKVGSFADIHPNYAQLLDNVPSLLAYASRYHEEKVSSQMSLLANKNNAEEDHIFRQIASCGKELSASELAFEEFDVLGLFLNNHPLASYSDIITELELDSTDGINSLPSGGGRIKLAGVIVKKDARMSKRGRFVTLMLSDAKGIIDVTIFSEEILRDYAELCQVRQMVVMEGDYYKDDGSTRITARKFHQFNDFLNKQQSELRLTAKNATEFRQMCNILERGKINDNGNCTIDIILPFKEGFCAKIELGSKLDFTPQEVITLKEYAV